MQVLLRLVIRKLDQVLGKLSAIEMSLEALLWALHNEGKETMSVLDDLKAQVAANTQVEASALALIQGLTAKLAAAIAANDPAQLQSLHDELATSASSLAAAVAANTPAAPAPAPVPAAS